MTQTTLPIILWRRHVTQTHLLLWLAANCRRSLHYTLIRRIEGDICSSVYAVFHRNYDFMCSLQYTHTPVQTSGEFELNRYRKPIWTMPRDLRRKQQIGCRPISLFTFLNSERIYLKCNVDVQNIRCSYKCNSLLLCQQTSFWICLCRHINIWTGPTAHDRL